MPAPTSEAPDRPAAWPSAELTADLDPRSADTLAAVVASAALLYGCSGARGLDLSTTTLLSDAEAARILQHAQFSSSESEIAALKSVGAASWLAAEMMRPSSQGGWDWLRARGYGVIDANKFYQMDYHANYMAWHQLMASPDAVRRRMALALSEFFVVGIPGVSTLHWPQFAVAAYWDVLCDHAFGNFRDLLEAVTLNIAMGEYLNTLGNQREDPATGRLPDENYAREVMQLFSIGLVQLNQDGTPRSGPDGQPIETFNQSDVSNLARVFTGWVADTTEGFSQSAIPPTYPLPNVGYTRRPMVLDPNRHSTLRADFLGARVEAGTDGRTALKIALDTLFQHPNVGPFFGRQMIQRLVSSDPSPAYVSRVAGAFNDNGKGVRGDLAAVFKAVLLDPEALSPAGIASLTFGKLREPMIRVAQWARTFRAASRQGTWKIGIPDYSASEALSQSPLQSPSVFNFFRPGYVPPATAMAARRATAPEFQLVNEGTTASYINYLQTFIWQGIWVRAPELITSPENPTPTDGPDIVPDYSAEMALAGNPRALIDRLNLLLCAGQLSSETCSMMVTALSEDRSTAASPENAKRSYVAKAIMFVMCCSEYLIQK